MSASSRKFLWLIVLSFILLNLNGEKGLADGTVAGQSPETTSQNSFGSRDEICSIADPALVSSKDIPLIPEYFFRPFPKSNIIAVAANSQNHFVNLDTGETVVVPGNYDALPLPDEKFWVYPTGSQLNFQKLSSGHDGGRVFSDPKMKGYYQSAGMVSNPNGGERYRIIIDSSDGASVGFLFQDYDPTSSGSIKPVYPNPKPLCKNLQGPYSLPMLSKDGTKIALLDVNAGHTNIYHINSITGNCTLQRALFQKTGKVDFSFDNNLITYHTVERMDADSITQHGNWLQTPRANMVANVWTMDLRTGVAKQITHFTDSSALYPAFNAKGQILVRKFRADGGSTILTYDPAKEPRSVDPLLFTSTVACRQESDKFAALATLGQLFADLCMSSNASFSPQSKVLFVQNLDKNSCHRLAQTFESNKGKVLTELEQSNAKNQVDLHAASKLELKNLLQVCPQEDIKGPRNQITKQMRPASPPDLTKVPAPMARCLTCHGPNSALPMPFDNVGALKTRLMQPSKVHASVLLIDEMKNRVESRAVPPANNLGAKSLTDDETGEVLSWLNTVQNTH
jgi:hypothetical protein